MTPAELLRKIVEDAKGDNLELAEAAFRGMSRERLQDLYGQSGRTHQEILDDYRLGRAEWQAARDMLHRLLGPVRP